MKLKRLEWRNIGPYGNKLQELDFSEKGGLWMVFGKNGNGKSFVVNMPKILYYGRLDKFKKEDIANRMNKHGWVYGDVQVNPTTNIKIDRKIAPQSLTVYKNDEDIGKALSGSYQDYIDIEVTGLPYHIFSNIISLSINDFKSFISMTPGDKRIIIDKLFGMEIINEMNKFIKEDLRNLKMDIQRFDTEISSLKTNITTASKELEKLQKRINEDTNTKTSELLEKIKELKEKLKDAKTKKEKYTKRRDEIKNAYDLYIKQRSDLSYDVRGIEKDLNLYNQDKCPTCATPFTEKRFEILKEELNQNFKLKKIELDKLNKNEEKYKEALEKTEDALNRIESFITQIKSVYSSIVNELNKLKKNKPKEYSSIENIISKNTIEVQKKETKKVDLDKDYKYKSILEQLYSDDGVKKRVLKSYLPTLNKEIEFTLHDLHFPYRLRFNDDFEPTIEHLGININVETLSTGEKKRVDLAVLISIIKMLKRKYPSLNIFMLDEVLSSIDGDGIYDIIGLLQKTAKDLMMNIFIINHSPLPIEFFDYKIIIEKKDGFSDLIVEELSSDL